MSVTLNSLVESIKLTVNPVFNTSNSTMASKIFNSMCSVLFNYTQSQINQLYNNSFLTLSSGNALDAYISQFSEILRKNSESDDDFRTRYLKFHFQYNSSEEQIKNIVYDVTNENALRVINLSDRHSYWSASNLGVSGNINTKVSYYDVEYDDNKSLWGDSDNNKIAYVAYIELNTRPNQPMIDELCNIISQIKVAGTKIYIKYPQLYRYDYLSSTYDEGSIYL